MVQKVKRFLVFMLFSMFFSLLGGKVSKAVSTPKNEACVIPNPNSQGITELHLDDDGCY